MENESRARELDRVSGGPLDECRYLRQGYGAGSGSGCYRQDELSSCDKGYPLEDGAVERCRAAGYGGRCWMRHDLSYQRKFRSNLAWKGFFQREDVIAPD
jgi:hypothetical protein